MGCPTEVFIGDNLVFSCCTHDPDTGILTDADAVPTYRIYEDETAVAILNGDMAKLDDANTLGFYTKLIACTAANGFEDRKTYTVYIEATVDGDEGGISYGFRAINLTTLLASINAEVVDALNVDTYAEPGQETPLATIPLSKKISYIYKFMRNRITQTATHARVYADDSVTVDQKAVVSDNGVQVDREKFLTGP